MGRTGDGATLSNSDAIAKFVLGSGYLLPQGRAAAATAKRSASIAWASVRGHVHFSDCANAPVGYGIFSPGEERSAR